MQRLHEREGSVACQWTKQMRHISNMFVTHMESWHFSWLTKTKARAAKLVKTTSRTRYYIGEVVAS